MRFNSVGFALSVGMALIVVLIGFTLLSAAGLTGFAAHEPAVFDDGIKTPIAADSTAQPLVTRPAPTAAETAEITVGDALFQGNCAQCHAVNEVVVGPALSGITGGAPSPGLCLG